MKALASIVVFLLLAPLVIAQEGAPADSDFGLLNARQPETGVLFGGQPDSGQLEAMARAGYGTVIDLRREDEPRGLDEAALLDGLDIEYVPIPVGSDTLQDPATYERFFESFADAERPLLVHCASGNRVGALYYAYLVAERGLDRAAALEEAQQQGLRSDALAGAVDQYLDSLER